MDHFLGVQIDRASETVREIDLGAFAGVGPPSARLLPDGGAFFYWGPVDAEGTTCTVGLRDAGTAVDRWTQPLCLDAVVAPLFISDGGGWLIVVLTADRLLALDGASGAVRWSWGRRVNGLSVPVTDVRVFGDALVVTSVLVEPRVRVIGTDGRERFNLPVGWTGASSGFVATSDGLLVGAGGSPSTVSLVSVQTADAGLNAPPHVCTLVDCGHGLADLARDPGHCGQCGHACQPQELCLDGSCMAEPTL
jgi:hypothetical protein